MPKASAGTNPAPMNGEDGYGVAREALAAFMPSALATVVENMQAGGPEAYKAAKELLKLALIVRRDELKVRLIEEAKAKELEEEETANDPLTLAMRSINDDDLTAILKIICAAREREYGKGGNHEKRSRLAAGRANAPGAGPDGQPQQRPGNQVREPDGGQDEQEMDAY